MERTRCLVAVATLRVGVYIRLNVSASKSSHELSRCRVYAFLQKVFGVVIGDDEGCS